MSRALLQQVGAFAPPPVPKKFEWTNDAGETLEFEFFVRHVAFGDIDGSMAKEGDERSMAALWLSKTVCFDPEGKDGLSYADAYALKPSFAKALSDAVSEVYAEKK